MKRKIESPIYRINNEQVLLDFQLPELFDTDKQTILSTLTKNRNRFPNDFIIEMNREEWNKYKQDNPALKEIAVG